jgi:hypothetical protein
MTATLASPAHIQNLCQLMIKYSHEKWSIHLLPRGPIFISHVYSMLVICESYMNHL